MFHVIAPLLLALSGYQSFFATSWHWVSLIYILPSPISLGFIRFSFISAYISLTDIWLATKEVDFEEDEFFHSKGIQPIDQSGCDTLYDRDRRRKQASYNSLRYSTLMITVRLLFQFILFISQNTLSVRGNLPQVCHVARRGSRSGTGIWQWYQTR